MRQVEDHTPNRWAQTRDCILLLSLDEFAELDGNPWIREATAEEALLERARLEAPFSDGTPGRQDVDEMMFHDSTPYLWVVVLRTAPGHIWIQASGHLRLHRFK